MSLSDQQLSIDEYSKISYQYIKSKGYIWRKHIEEYSIKNIFEKMFTNRNDLNILELACGGGHYTNKLYNEWKFARKIVATDLSPDMISIAKNTYINENINFEVHDACSEISFSEDPFEIVFAAYLINYCTNYGMLLKMCSTIKKNLIPKGKFISINDGSLQRIETYNKVPGFIKVPHINPDRVKMLDFEPFIVKLSDPLSTTGIGCEFTNYWISTDTIKKAFLEVGFSSLEILPIEKSCDNCICSEYTDNQALCLIIASN